MRTSFPVQFVGNLLGKSREGGEFVDRDSGEKVEYGDAYDISFENSQGLTQTVRVAEKNLDEVADFDVRRAERFAVVNVVGDVSIGDGRPGSFRASQVGLVKPSVKATASS